MTRWNLFASFAVVLLATTETKDFRTAFCENSTGGSLYNQSTRIDDKWIFESIHKCSLNNSVLVVKLINHDLSQCDKAFIKTSGFQKITLCSLQTCLLLSDKIYPATSIIDNCTSVAWKTGDAVLPTMINIRKPSTSRIDFTLKYNYVQLNFTNGVLGGGEPKNAKQTDKTATAVLVSAVVILSVVLICLLARRHWNKIKDTASQLGDKLGLNSPLKIPSVQVAVVSNGVYEASNGNVANEDATVDDIYHEVDAHVDRIVVDNQLYGFT